MKRIIFILITTLAIISCSSTPKAISSSDISSNRISDTVKISNEELEYEVIIIDGGFNSWLNSVAKPRGFYTESFLEGKNQIYVSEWNNRFLQPNRYNSNLYEMQINYNSTIHYGYEVNYLIYNYFIYFQITNKQQLAGFVPTP